MRRKTGTTERERFSEATCPICGKRFGIPDSGLWVYKSQWQRKGVQRFTYFCSWKCFRIHEKQREEFMRENDGRKTRWKRLRDSNQET